MSGTNVPPRHGQEQHESSTYPATGLGLGLERLPQNLNLSYSQFSSSYPQATTEVTAYPGSEYPSREATTAAFLPEVLVFSPQAGECGELVIISVRSAHDISESQGISLSISFSGVVCPVSIQPLASGVGLAAYQYAVSFRVPQIQHAGATLAVMCPMDLILHSSQPQISGTIPVGTFTLRGSNASQSSHSTSPTPGSSALSRREASADREALMSRRSSHQAAFDDITSRARSSSYTQQPLLYQGVGSVPSTSYGQPCRGQAYGPIQPTQEIDTLKRSASVPTVQPWDDEEHIHPAHKANSYPLESVRRAQRHASHHVSLHSRRSSPPPTPGYPSTSNPPLVRTSMLASASGSSAGTGFSSPATSHGFNPYAMYPSKAHLKIDGDLDRMACGWSDDEIAAKRRLVEFKRNQSGHTITTTFKPVTPEQRAPNSICVSCIWWEEKDECFVTSVDTIQLLESLVGVRFTVEEKNRIRRNLEGFRPLTVAKGKTDSERFFKIIMDFPNPKPRNIEKDVKVFPWKILANSLKKIIGKYSASYASTASALHYPSAFEGPNYAAHGQKYGDSPHSQSSSTFSFVPGHAAARSPYITQPPTSEPHTLYHRPQPQAYSPPANSTPAHTPHQPQYASYAPVDYSWSSAEQHNSAYEQTQQLPRGGTWTPQFQFDGSPISTSTPQFGPAQSHMTLPLQQRQATHVTPGYGQYIPQGSQA